MDERPAKGPGRPVPVWRAETGPRGAMIDWTAVFTTLPDQFTLDSLLAHETAGEKPPAYHRQVVARWLKEGRVRRTGRGMYEKT